MIISMLTYGQTLVYDLAELDRVGEVLDHHPLLVNLLLH